MQNKARFRVKTREVQARQSVLKALRGDDKPKDGESSSSSAFGATGPPPVPPGPIPRLRMHMTLPEIRVLMQQGVAETPSFQVGYDHL